MPRLSPVDASFLRVETPTAHMHVGWTSVLDLPPGRPALDTRLLVERLEARLHLAPRFRQRVVKVPLGVAEPAWRDVPDFDIARHVREAAGPAELAHRDLRVAAGKFLSRPLDRDRPLWEILVVPRVQGGRAALVGKVHHAMVDGIAAVELGALMFDLGPEPGPSARPDWSPEPPEGALRLTADAAIEQFRTARRLAAMGRSPGQTIRLADTMRRAAFSLAEDALRPAPSSYLNVAIGPERTLVTHRVWLSRLLAIKRRYGATLNDVTLAVCSGALRRYAVKSGEEPRDLRVMVPVNVRESSDEPAEGNRITFAFIDLPVSRRGAEERLDRVVAQMTKLKTSGRIAGSKALLQGLGVLPEPLKDLAARMAVSPRLYNLTISNVPGPRMTLYAGGARVRSIYPVIPVPDRHALAIGVLTYEGHAHFGIYADPCALTRVGRLPVMIDDAVAELELQCGGRRELRRGG